MNNLDHKPHKEPVNNKGLFVGTKGKGIESSKEFEEWMIKLREMPIEITSPKNERQLNELLESIDRRLEILERRLNELRL